MSDIAVIYASHYGFTEAYARWLAQELAADLLEAGKVKSEDLEATRRTVEALFENMERMGEEHV